MSVVDAQAAGLIGLKVGDTLPQSEDGWSHERWVVEAIVPAVVHAVRDAMMNFAQRFPREPFFIKGFHIGDLASVRDFAPFIASLEAQRARAAHVLKIYREQMLPLGFLEQMLPSLMSDLMEGLSTNPQNGDLLPVEWAAREEQRRSVAAAQEANEVVVTRSALKTAADRALLAQLAGTFTLVAPASLFNELRDQLREAEADVTRGRAVLTGGGIGLGTEALPAGSPRLLERLEAARAVLSWLEVSARLEPRPLLALQAAAPDEEELRDFIGKSSADALDLVKHLGATLYADDLGLRRLLFEQANQTRSFSTVSLLPALVERGVLTREEHERHLLALVGRRYAMVLPTRDLLIAAVRRWSDLGRNGVAQSFALLGGPGITAGEAARTTAQVIRWLVTAPLEVVSTGTVVRMALTGMSARWPTPLCSRLVAHAAGEELALMPQHLDTVRQVCAAFARGSLELS
ncbi:hypothetical protein D7X32_30660 [Corallococcus carmarthensis]|uniref:PIN domain-containing protein n=2 Tax=Corallococcus carmarthensis TaxID=2316728 RepID=A0A3A8JSD3_9BACT|nr:hypothetical protein D7X32_30660 [Corallococcus carmarthensis]